MPLYVCRFCDYNSKAKKTYYCHLYKHINDNNASFDKEELELCTFYHNKESQKNKEYRQNNKDKESQRCKEYRKNNKDKIKEYNQNNKELQRKTEYYKNNREKIKQYKKEYRLNNRDKELQRKTKYYKNNREKIKHYNKEYRLRKKLEKEEANILDVYDSD
jgi:hypothetical protein